MAQTQARRRLPLAFVPLVLAYLAIALNMTVTNVALPTISVDLQVSAAALIWIVNVTPMASAALVLFAGSWGDRFGRRRLLVIGLTIFLVSATLSAAVTSPWQLIVLRALTGVGSALAMPAALALTFDVVAEPSRRTAVGIIGATQAVGSLLGPIVAGSLLLVFSWGSAFLSVVPLLIVALVLVLWKVPADSQREENPASLDLLGATLTGVVGVSFLYAAVTASTRDAVSDVLVILALIVGAIALVCLVAWEIRYKNPIFVGSVLRSRTFWVPTLVIFGVQFALGGVMFLNTQYVQLVLGFSAFAAGLFLVPALGTWIASSATAGMTARRLGVRVVVVVSLLAAAIGMVLIASGGLSPQYGLFIIGLLLVGCMGVAPALTTHMAVSAYPEDRRTVGSAINSMAVRFGLAFGVATLGSVLGLVYSRDLAPALQGMPPGDQALAENSLGGALQVAARLGGPAGQALTDAARSAFASGFSVTMTSAAVILGLLAVVAAIWLPSRAARGQAVQEPTG